VQEGGVERAGVELAEPARLSASALGEPEQRVDAGPPQVADRAPALLRAQI
jgi:hypothetical protein